MTDDMYEQDAQPETSDALVRITQLADLLREQQRQVAQLEEALRDAKEAARRTEREDLPTLMAELGLGEIKLLDGTTVTVAHDVECGISVERMPAAIAWLTAHGYDGILKTKLSMEFGRGEVDEAELIAREISALSERSVDVAQTIHPQTLKAFVKERMEAGEAIPFDTFGIMPFDRVKLKAPRPTAAASRKR